MSTAGAAVLAIFLILVAGLYVAGIVFWILKIVEVARIPDLQFRAAGSDKVAWILVVVLAQIIGALIWQFAKRADVLAAAGRVPPPPPGWYPESGGSLRWWDGWQWTPYRHSAPPEQATGPGPDDLSRS